MPSLLDGRAVSGYGLLSCLENFTLPLFGYPDHDHFCIVLGIIEGYATIALKSVIPTTMIHSTVNAGALFHAPGKGGL